MKLTWFGHSAFRLDTGNAHILIDPFLTENPSWGKPWQGPAEGVTHVLLTHGHGDHLGDSAAILKETGAMLVANFELCMFLVGEGVDSGKINPGNFGGTVDCGGFTTTFVPAWHSSALPQQGGRNVFLGNPGGLVLHFPSEKTLYHMGDTDIFSDMALIDELHEPKIGLVPIGDRFTMGGAVAALACRRYFHFETVVPCHYGSFDMIDQDADKFVAGLEGSGIDVKLPEVGDSLEL